MMFHGCAVSNMRDDYGNVIIDGEYEELIYCTFPDCGCDGERLCMAKNGASDTAKRINVEGMYRSTSGKALRARAGLLTLVHERDKREQASQKDTRGQ